MARVLKFFAFLGSAFTAQGSEQPYDFIIVGGGAAGSVLANRLSKSGQHSVLLMNIAGAPPDAYRGPVLLSDEFIVQKNLTANSGLKVQINQPGYSPVRIFSVAETGSSPARWLGGSSLVGLSLYMRDHPEALEAWGEGWGWEEMRKHFHKVENLGQTCYGGTESCGDYGTSGPFRISKEPAYTHPLSMDFIAAAKAAGLEETKELNTMHSPAVGVTPTSQHGDGTKVNTFDAFLRPALGRSNLRILHGVRADRLIMDGDRCRGVAYRELATSEDKVVFAKREVIVSAGYVYSPRLLFLSGLGPRKELEDVGLSVVQALPAVGKHLTSARYSPLSWSTNKGTLSHMLGSPISPAGFTAEPNAYQSTVQEALARFRSKKAAAANPHSTRPDVTLSFMPVYQALKSAPLQFSLQGEPWPLKTNAYTLLVTLGETEAKGEVTFPSGSPDVSPVITHAALTDTDWELAQEAVAFAMEVGNNSALGGKFIDNGAGRRDAFSAIYDGRGSCRMGKSREDSVVDLNLRVHGLRSLRVVDGSVIPHASPYLALPEVLALAERASEFILAEHEEEESKNNVVPSANLMGPLDFEVAPSANFSIKNLKKMVGERASLLDMVAYQAKEVEESVQFIANADAHQPSVYTIQLLLVASVASAAVFSVVKFGPRNSQRLSSYEPLLA